MKKLDDKETFDSVKTGIIKNSDLPTKVIRENYKALFNHAKTLKLCGRATPESITDIRWVAKCFNKLKEFVQTYSGYTKDTTRRIQYETIAWILISINKKKHKEDSRWFWNQAMFLQDKIDKARDENLFTDDQLQNYVSYSEMLKTQQKWNKAWLQDPKNVKLNIYHLLLALNTLIPPMRKNYHDMEFWRKKEAPPVNETNYLWEQYPSRWTMVVNYDKVENKRRAKDYDRQEMKLEDEIEGVTNGKKLNEIINKSLVYLPRDYVLPGIRNKDAPMNRNSYDKAFQTIFNKKVTQNVIRKAYVNHFYGKSSLGVKKQIAYKMRHSVQVAEQSYQKINIPKAPKTSKKAKDASDNDEDDNDVEDNVNEPPAPRQPVPKPVAKRTYFDPSAYSKAYREKHPSKIKQQRADYYVKNKEKAFHNQMAFFASQFLVYRMPSYQD